MDENKPVTVSFYEHESALMHYNHANRRMLIALITVCLTFVITILVFVTGYTQREKNWLDTIRRTGVSDGIHEQSDSP